MKRIPLTQNRFAIIGDEDYEELSKYNWRVFKNHYGGYIATRGVYDKTTKKHHTFIMHRMIMGLVEGDKLQVDHINHNTLDNRRSNLRVCTNQQNQMNRSNRKNGSSKFKGIYWYKANEKWRARIMLGGKRKDLGYYINEIEAAKAYDHAAKEMFGDFAYLNFP